MKKSTSTLSTDRVAQDKTLKASQDFDACHDWARLRNAFLMAYDLAGVDATPVPEVLPESAYVPGYMDKVRELREVFALASAQVTSDTGDSVRTNNGQAS